jgi:KUP system potassium uptake protein
MTPVPEFLARIAKEKTARVPGTAVFLTRTAQHIPPVMLWHVAYNRALHEHVFILRVEVIPVPRVGVAERFTVAELARNFWRIDARYGFMEHPDIPKLVEQASLEPKCRLDLDDLTYYVGHETVVRRAAGKRMPAWQATPYMIMQRNAVHISDFLHLPTNQVVEIGRQVAI